VIAMNRFVRSCGLLAVFAGTALAAGCASAPKDEYAENTRPARECSTGSRICSSGQDAAESRQAQTVVDMPADGGDVIGTLRSLPSVTVRSN
jgi:hypothetical protein